MSIFSVAMDSFFVPYPAGPDIAFSAILAGLVVLNLVGVALAIAGLISGLVSLSRHRHLLGGSELALWVAIVALAPILGAIAWFAIGRTRTREVANAAMSTEPPSSSS